MRSFKLSGFMVVTVLLFTFGWWVFYPSFSFSGSMKSVYLERKNDGIQLSTIKNISIHTTVQYPRIEFKYIVNMNNINYSKPMPDFVTTLKNPWKHNKTKVEILRSRLEKSTRTQMSLAQNNMKSSRTYHLVYLPKSKIIDKSEYSTIIKVFPFQKGNKRCSVVGNAGILKGSKCGKEIDNHDLVFRFNIPPLNGFSEDVGLKSNIVTLNPSMLYKKGFGNLNSNSGKANFTKVMKEYKDYLWFPSLTTSISFKQAMKIVDVFKKSHELSLQLLHANPDHFRDFSAFWKKIIRGRLSTGFYLTSCAILYCDEVHVYGFWPFTKDLHGRNTTYHYFEEKDMSSKNPHAFNDEFDELMRLHSEGVLKMHIDNCH